MSNSTPAQPSDATPAEQSNAHRSYAAGEQAYQSQKAAEHDQAVADGTVTPDEAPHPLSWG